MPEFTSKMQNGLQPSVSVRSDNALTAALENSAYLAVQICQVPVALITITRDGQQVPQANLGWAEASDHANLWFCEQTALQQRPLIIPDTLQFRECSGPAATGPTFSMRFYAGIPLIGPGSYSEHDTVGVLSVMDRVAHQLQPDQIDGLCRLGQQISMQLTLQAKLKSLSRKQVAKDKRIDTLLQSLGDLQSKINAIEQQHREERLLNQIDHALQTCPYLEDAYSILSKLIQPLFPADTGAIYMRSDDSLQISVAASWGNRTAIIPSLEYQPSPDQNQLLQCPSYLQDIHQSPPGGSLCVPLGGLHDPLGMLYLRTAQIGQVNLAKQELAQKVATRITFNLQHLKQLETLRNQSIRDPLTGLFNRRYMDEAIEQIIQRARHGHEQVGVIMLDIDHFKKFNDTFGHQAGDYVLQDFSVFLKGHVRGTDIACRYGGEEFMFILSATPLRVAIQRAERLRRGIKYLQMHYEGKRLSKVTISVGVAVFPEHALTAETLVQAADKALYRAKTQGRDRVSVAQSLKLNQGKPEPVPELLT